MLTNFDSSLGGEKSFITLGIEIVVTGYLIYRFKNLQNPNKYF